jgi:hypothetical protein
VPLRLHRFFLLVLAAALSLLAGPVSAASLLEPAQASLRLRYGLSFREGSQLGVGPGVSYAGMTPNDVALWAAVYGPEWWGAWLSVQREGFSLTDGQGFSTGTGLLRASVGPVAWRRWGPVRAELSAGYALAQLPVFSRASTPVLEGAVRHSVWVGGRVLVALPLPLPEPWRLLAEVRGEVPLALATQDAAGAATASGGFGLGGALILPVRRIEAWGGRVLLDYHYIRDGLTTVDGARSEQAISRLGVALELTWGEEELPTKPPPGELAITVVDASTGQPLPGSQVVVVAEGLAQPPRPVDASGRVEGLSLPAGEVLAQVTAEGYLPAEGRITVPPGSPTALEVRMRLAPPPPGRLKVVVLDIRGRAPLAGVLVKAGEVEGLSDAKGLALLEGVPPGPVEVQVTAEGFRPMREAVIVLSGEEVSLELPLLPAGQLVPATLTGQVRSVREGKPLRALLSIPEARVRLRTDPRGTFQVQLKQGRYRVIFSAPGHITQTKDISVREGEQAIFNVDLFPKSR